MKKTERISIAKNTLDIIENGFYQNNQHQKIEIVDNIKKCIENSILFKENEFEILFSKRDELFTTQNSFETNIEVTTETTLEAAKRMNKFTQKIFCLNFASAKNEGGGFLGGAQAQEESLARSSALYPCLTKFHHDFYNFHTRQKNSYYSSNMIFSPNVPVFKDDEGDLLDNFYDISFLTSPAVNVGALKDKQEYNEEKYQQIMFTRLENILTIAYIKGYENLILGAFGCGVFRNDPKKVAKLFAQHLTDSNGVFKNRFKNIVFAIYSSYKEESENYLAFRDIFNK